MGLNRHLLHYMYFMEILEWTNKIKTNWFIHSSFLRSIGSYIVHFLECEMIIIKWTHCVWMHLLSRLQCDIHFHITIGICFCLISFHSSRAGKKEKKIDFRQISKPTTDNDWAHSDFFQQLNYSTPVFTQKNEFLRIFRHFQIEIRTKKPVANFEFSNTYSNYSDEVIDSRYLWKHCIKTKTIDNLEASRKF